METLIYPDLFIICLSVSSISLGFRGQAGPGVLNLGVPEIIGMDEKALEVKIWKVA